MRLVISKQNSFGMIDEVHDVQEIRRQNTFLQTDALGSGNMLEAMSPIRSINSHSLSLSGEVKDTKIEVTPIENPQILERNRMLKLKTEQYVRQAQLLNKSNQSEVSNCPICLDPLMRKFSVRFKCKRHFGHHDCVEFYYLNLEEPTICPYKCLEKPSEEFRPLN